MPERDVVRERLVDRSPLLINPAGHLPFTSTNIAEPFGSVLTVHDRLGGLRARPLPLPFAWPLPFV